MNKIVINFKDYIKISEQIPKEEELSTNDLRQICNNTDDNRESLFIALCDRILSEVRRKRPDVLFDSEVQTDDKGVEVFSYYNGELWTGGYVGTINVNINNYNITVNLRSRFDDDNSRFLMYIFLKSFNGNGKIYKEMTISGNKEKTWDLLLMILFVRYLHEAFKKGIYKQYQEFEHNDSNVKGRIDISRHIKENILFNGKICYTTREFTVNNPINQLILKACFHLERKYRKTFRGMIASDDVIKKGIHILQNEINDWMSVPDQVIIKNSNNKIVQSVSKNYEPLRKTAIVILKRMGINSFKNSVDSVSGVLINMPSLWEVFLHNEVFCKIRNTEEKYHQNVYPILGEKKTLKPDFLLGEIGKGVVFDAKYKKVWSNVYRDDIDWSDTRVRDDIFQVMSYMYALGCRKGGIIFPLDACPNLTHRSQSFEIGQALSNTKDTFCLVPYFVPQNVDDFYQAMSNESEKMIDTIQRIINETKTDNEST